MVCRLQYLNDFSKKYTVRRLPRSAISALPAIFLQYLILLDPMQKDSLPHPCLLRKASLVRKPRGFGTITELFPVLKRSRHLEV